MLKIGEFSRLSQVTVKTLHHYDDIGLLKPAQINQFTGYRYYSVDQLARIHRIMALKDLGLSLDQIALMLNEDLAHDEIRGMLRLQQAEIQQRVREEQARLSQVEFRLRLIEMDDKMPEMDIIVKKIPPFYALTLRRSMNPKDMIPFGLEIEQAQVQHGVKLVGPVTEIRFEEEYQSGHEDVEFALPVVHTHKNAMPLSTFGIFEPKSIPGLDMAATYIQKGVNPAQIAEKLPVFRRWIVDNGYQLCSTHRLVFHRGPAEHAEYGDWIVEFQHEIAPV